MTVFAPLFTRLATWSLANFSWPAGTTVYDKAIVDYFLSGTPSADIVGNRHLALTIETFCRKAGDLCLTHVPKQINDPKVVQRACGSGCHQCTFRASGGTCEMCRDKRYLHAGKCIRACPDGTVPHGAGNYKRVCGAHISVPG